jgi:hypothetical protein
VAAPWRASSPTGDLWRDDEAQENPEPKRLADFDEREAEPGVPEAEALASVLVRRVLRRPLPLRTQRPRPSVVPPAPVASTAPSVTAGSSGSSGSPGSSGSSGSPASLASTGSAPSPLSAALRLASAGAPAPSPSTREGLSSSLPEGPHGERVQRMYGPYRVSGGWWKRTVERDYYYAETDVGGLLWVYWDRPRAAWFMHGTVD